MNWKEQLASFLEANPDLPEGADTVDETQEPTKLKQPRLDISLERKGRAGKTVTLITGWLLSDDELQRIASQIKQALATGGSAGGGEILVQGDRRKDVAAHLQRIGYKTRII